MGKTMGKHEAEASVLGSEGHLFLSSGTGDSVEWGHVQTRPQE